MATVKEHYDQHLAEWYVWMLGDFPEVLSRNAGFFGELGIEPQGSGRAVDLGCGPGTQSIPLGRAGFSVTAIDFCDRLLDRLKAAAEDLPIRPVKGDLLQFGQLAPEGGELVVCMGDTLTHLPSLERVGELFSDIRDYLEDGGKLVLGFRDLTSALHGPDRFLSVRATDEAIFTCCLEYGEDVVDVTDLIYTRNDCEWQLLKSSYKKLRIGTDWVRAKLDELGFVTLKTDCVRGMNTIVAQR